MAISIRFYIDPATGEPHIYNHNVDENEVEDVLGGRERIGPAVTVRGLQLGKLTVVVTFGSFIYRILKRVVSL